MKNEHNEQEAYTKKNGVDGIWIQSGPNNGNGLLIKVEEMSSDCIGLRGINISTQESASQAINSTKQALAIISEKRSRIGAYQNRLEHTIGYVDNSSENLQASASRIRDADISKEVTALAKHNILEQAGQMLLVQANQSKDGILSLLQ